MVPFQSDPPDGESTVILLRRVRDGDVAAPEILVRRYMSPLLRWAHGRLPWGARDVMDTQDLVQVTFVRALDHIDRFEPRWQGAFFAYLRRILVNQIRDEIRRAGRRPVRDEMTDALPSGGRTPLEVAVGRDLMERYERAMEALPETQQQAVFLRVELGLTYQEIAEALDRPSMNAARMLVSRALLKLSEALHDQGIEAQD